MIWKAQCCNNLKSLTIVGVWWGWVMCNKMRLSLTLSLFLCQMAKVPNYVLQVLQSLMGLCLYFNFFLQTYQSLTTWTTLSLSCTFTLNNFLYFHLKVCLYIYPTRNQLLVFGAYILFFASLVTFLWCT